MLRLPRPASLLVYAGLFLACVAGCSSKHKGTGTIGSNGKNVDASWINATKTCWPDLGKNGFSNDDIARNLASPTHFRDAFPVYGAQNDDALDVLLAKPVQTAPPPDVSRLTHSQTPVFNRGQAVNGTNPKDAVVQSTNGIAPPDAFCSLQPGTPQGFSK
ncbi:MAG: hypothetical protein INR62_13085 [Rhodospirillales bacterium]|nr:hypothetical protein [Acetobacter sp.]